MGVIVAAKEGAGPVAQGVAKNPDAPKLLGATDVLPTELLHGKQGRREPRDELANATASFRCSSSVLVEFMGNTRKSHFREFGATSSSPKGQRPLSQKNPHHLPRVQSWGSPRISATVL